MSILKTYVNDEQGRVMFEIIIAHVPPDTEYTVAVESIHDRYQHYTTIPWDKDDINSPTIRIPNWSTPKGVQFQIESPTRILPYDVLTLKIDGVNCANAIEKALNDLVGHETHFAALTRKSYEDFKASMITRPTQNFTGDMK